MSHVSFPRQVRRNPVHLGDDVQMPIRLVDGAGVSAVELTIIAPPAVVKFVSADARALPAGASSAVNEDFPGHILFAAAFTAPVTNPKQPLLVLNFEAVAVGGCLIAVALQRIDEEFVSPPGGQIPVMAVEVT